MTKRQQYTKLEVDLISAIQRIRCPAEEVEGHDTLHCIRCWCYGMANSEAIKAIKERQ